MASSSPIAGSVEQFREAYARIAGEIQKVIVGLDDVIEGTMAGLFCGGHVLLEGVPGIGKTLLIKSVSDVLGLNYKRIQFTPDLMPSDITGTEVLSEDDTGRRSFQFKAGPVFANVVLADEINRATPKTQAALLEAMAERQVTVLDKTYKLPDPFFVLATQNPIELEGTYPLPEAQLDRFLLKLWVPSPSTAELKEVLVRTTSEVQATLQALFSSEDAVRSITTLRSLVRQVVSPDPLLDILVRFISMLQPDSIPPQNLASQNSTPGGYVAPTDKVKRYVRFGPGPRGAQSVLLVSKFYALRAGRIHISAEDIQKASIPALRHRLVLNFQAEADGVTSDDIIADAIRR